MGDEGVGKIFLPLSGIQHMAFCPRQWALIHLEQMWAENYCTIEGKYLHMQADNPYIKEKRRDLIVSRAMPIISEALKLQGIADIVEFYRSETKEDAVTLEKKLGYWNPVPVEYKKGKSKADDRDRVQVCAQGICLEEMMGVHIYHGYLYYGATHSREEVIFTEELRYLTKKKSDEMYELFLNGTTPPAVKSKKCCLCSLIDLCVPELTSGNRNVKRYISRMTQLELEEG